MPKKNRLSGTEIRSIRSPRRLHGDLFSLSFVSGGVTPRFSCVVSKKVAAKAVDRNLIKRRMKAALEPFLKSTAPGSFMLLAKKQALGAPYQAVRRDIQNLLSAARSA